jgi:GTP cyclohydrolase I
MGGGAAMMLSFRGREMTRSTQVNNSNHNEKLYQLSGLIEEKPLNREMIQAAVRNIIGAIGEDPDREGLLRTPERVAGMYEELLSGYRIDPVALINGAIFDVAYDEIVIVRDIEFYSLCEHHMLPFIGRAHVAYIPDGRVVGLSKIPRIVDMFAHRLQIQERMTRQIADFIDELLHPKGTAVVIEAVHLCSMIRGVKKHDARMTTSTMLGSFRTNMATRMEFLDNISRSPQPMNF